MFNLTTLAMLILGALAALVITELAYRPTPDATKLKIAWLQTPPPMHVAAHRLGVVADPYRPRGIAAPAK